MLIRKAGKIECPGKDSGCYLRRRIRAVKSKQICFFPSCSGGLRPPRPTNERRSRICLAPKARLHASLGHRPRTLIEWGTNAESAIQTVGINAMSDVSEARSRMKPRLQRLVFEIETNSWGV